MNRLSSHLAALVAAAALVSVPLSVAAQATLPRVLVWDASLGGPDQQPIRWPVAVASRTASEIAVADAAGPRVVVFTAVGETWQVAQTVDLPAAPVALVADGRRYLASLRGDRGLIELAGPELALRPLPLPAGTVPGPLATLAGGGFAVYDFASGTILTFEEGGTPGPPLAAEGRVAALAPADNGALYLAVAQTATIRRTAASGAVEATWRLPGEGPVPAWPTAVAVDPHGEVVVADGHGARLLLLDRSGTVVGIGGRRGWDAGQLLRPVAVCILADGHLAVADLGTGRVDIFRRLSRSEAP